MSTTAATTVNTTTSPSAWVRANRLTLLTALALAVTVFLLWLPTGWHASPLSDNWVMFNIYDMGSSPVMLENVRVFGLIPSWLQYVLTPNSWLGQNLVLALVLFAKGLAVYALVRELIPRQAPIAFASALLYTVYYADNGVFWPIAVNVHASTLWALLAAWLLVRQWRKPSPWGLILMAVFQVLALSYEGVFAVVALTPLLLLFPAGGVNRRVVKLALIWYIAPAVMAVRYGIIATQNSAEMVYQEGQANAALQGDVLRASLASLERIFKRLLGVVWYDQKQVALEQPTYWIIAALIGLLAAGSIFVHLRAGFERLNWRLAAVIVGLGLLIIGVGFAPYLVSEFRDVNYRVFFTAMIGASLAWAALVYFLSFSDRRVKIAILVLSFGTLLIFQSRLLIGLSISFGLALVLLNGRWVFTLVLAALITVNTYFTLVQHQLHANAPLGQHWMLSDIIEQAPQPADDTMIVIIEETPGAPGMMRFEWRRDILHHSLQYLYENRTLNASFCFSDPRQYNYFKETCAFEDDGYHYSFTQASMIVPYERLLVFTYDDTTGLTLLETLPNGDARYQPLAIAGVGQPIPRRAPLLLDRFPTPRPDKIIDYSRLL